MRWSKIFSTPTRKSNPYSSAPYSSAQRSFALVILAVLLAIPSGAQTAAPDSSRSSGWVVISVSEYETLRAGAYPGEREPEPPPVDATLTRVDYDLNVLGEQIGRAS